MAVTMDQVAAATPAMRQALGELEVSIDRAIRESRARRPRDKR
jgi:hypothetical protein